MSNVYLLLALGLLGYAMLKAGLPLAPFILGVILRDPIEITPTRWIMTHPDPWLLIPRPSSGSLLFASAAPVAFARRPPRRPRLRGRSPNEAQAEASDFWATDVTRANARPVAAARGQGRRAGASGCAVPGRMQTAGRWSLRQPPLRNIGTSR